MEYQTMDDSNNSMVKLSIVNKRNAICQKQIQLIDHGLSNYGR